MSHTANISVNPVVDSTRTRVAPLSVVGGVSPGAGGSSSTVPGELRDAMVVLSSKPPRSRAARFGVLLYFLTNHVLQIPTGVL